jgi:hypothetical protein
MGTCTSTAGTEAEGYSEIRSGNCEKCRIPFEVTEQEGEEPDIRRCPECGGLVGELLVAFSSEDINGFWSQLYQKERIIYAMRHRRDSIPEYLRTGEPPPSIKREAIKLRIKNLLRR